MNGDRSNVTHAAVGLTDLRPFALPTVAAWLGMCMYWSHLAAHRHMTLRTHYRRILRAG